MIETGKRMKEKIKIAVSFVIMVALLVTNINVTAFAATGSQETSALDAFTELSDSNECTELQTGNYKVTSGTVTYSQGLKIAENATVYIYIAENATLQSTGVNGSGTTGGTAGIMLPSSSTLYLVGNGTVIATGGNAGNGADGGDGVTSTANAVYTSSTSASLAAGKGGNGGNGGGGAGAGIGSNGGTGGTGGTGGSGYTLTGKSAMDVGADGKSGDPGNPGGASAEMGTLYCSSKLTTTITGGSAGTEGTGGKAGYCSDRLYNTTYYGDDYRSVAGGAGGGGGGAGYAAADIGTGGAGGAGGGGGGSAGYTWSIVYIGAGGGGAGEGATSGTVGKSGFRISNTSIIQSSVIDSDDNETYLRCYFKDGDRYSTILERNNGNGFGYNQYIVKASGTTGGTGAKGYIYNGSNVATTGTAGNGGNGGTCATTEGAAKTPISSDTVIEFLDADSSSSSTMSAVASQTLGYAEKPTVPTEPTKTGYTFAGWYKDSDCTEAFDFTSERTTIATTENAYAKFVANTYEISLSSDTDTGYTGTTVIYERFDDGYYLNSGITDSKKMSSNQNKILIPRKSGYTFAGYYTEQNGSGTKIIDDNGYLVNDNPTYSSNITLYANWEEKIANYTIQYHANGGTTIADASTSQSRTYTVADDTFALKSMSSMFTAPVSSTAEACGFLGWSTSPSSSAAEYTDGASVSDFTDVDGATIHLYAVWSSTLPTSIQNGSFESPAIGSWYSIMSDSNSLIAWKTTAGDGKIELARPSKNMSAANSAYHTTTAVDGYQFAELCANQVGALYQTVSTFSGNTLKWGFSHKGRSGVDTMELWIGKPDDVTAVLNYYTSHNNSVAGISEDEELSAKYNTIKIDSYTDGNTQWNSYTGDYVVPEGQIETTFAFVSIAASGNKISFGNLLDNVYFTAEVPPKTQVFQYDATKGGSAVAQVNGIATSGSEALVSVGSTFEIYPAANEGYTYNGGFVNGEYKSVDELPLSYTVSDADTSLKKITLLFSKDSTIIFDKEGGSYADDEYDLKASGNNQCYTLKANPTKEGYAFKNWVIAGSNVTLTEGNYIAYETDADSKTYIRVYTDDTKGTLLYQCESEFGINLIATYRFTAFPSAKVELSLDGGEIDGNVNPLTYELNTFDLSDSATQSDIVEYSALTLPTPTKDGYVFAGWKIDEETYDAGTEIKYEISITNENGIVTIGTDAQGAITSDTTYTLTAQWEISYIETDADVTVSGDKKNPSSQWYTGDVTMKPDTGYKIRKEGDSQWKNELVITDEGRTSVTYQLTDSNGNITESRTKDICIDRLSPSGEISVGSDNSNKWNAFLNAITFGRFFKETQIVKISGVDEVGGSGVNKVYYYVSETELTQEQVCALEDSDWKAISNNDTFNIDPDKKLIIYAKIPDEAGNTILISSDGLVLDKTPPVIAGVTDGKSYCGGKTITVKDANLDTVTVNGTSVTLTDDSYDLSPSEDNGKTFTIVATDKAGNSTTVNVTIYKEHNWPDDWTVTKPATATAEGKKEQECGNCKQKKYQTIPAIGSQEDSATGSLTKDAEVTPDAPVKMATLNNAKSEIVSAAGIFTDDEKDKIINQGKEARIWLEISKTDVNKIAQDDQTRIMDKAEQIMGENPDITYFDADLFKQVDGGSIDSISEPGIYIEVTIQIPEDLLNHDRVMIREYKIIRLHGGTVDVISDGIYNESTGEFTFKTNKFSTYAIAYSDTPRPGSTTGGGGGGGGSTAISVTKITVTPEKGTLTKKGETLSLTAKVVPTSATNKKVTWTSSDPKVATVDENGIVTAVSDGTVTITAKTANGKSASSIITVKITPEEPDDGDIQMDTTYRKLRLRVPTSTKTTNVLKWTKQTGADGYVIYGNKCNTSGKTYKMVQQIVIKDGSTTTWTDKNLDSGTYYKYYIKAYKLVDGKKVWLAKSKVVHSTTTGGKYGNAKSVKVNKTSVSLAAGKTFTIKAEQVIKDKPIAKHANIKFESSNSKVVSVTSKGVIKAKSKGTCYIYVYAQNGIYKRIKVIVQ